MAGIYVHIPFCKRRCGYCDFYSSTDTELLSATIDGICNELRRERDFLREPVGTLYFGGGTPSLCTPGQLQRVVDTVRDTFPCSLEEITAEANPDDLTPQYLDSLALTDINRLSIGVQSFIDRDLQLMGRRHSAQQAVEAVRDAVKRFSNMTIDLIFGIPGMSLKEWRMNLEAALDLGVQHISAYHLTLEEGTPFGKMTPIDDSTSEEQFLLLHETLSAAGYEHYEVSNFALPGYRARHNSSYWRGEPYLGAGPGAHSFDGRVRRHFGGTVPDYIAGKGGYVVETLSDTDRRNELIMTRLRTAEGLPDALVPTGFDPEPFVARGLLEHIDGHWRIPPAKFLLSDIVIGGLFE